MYNYTVKSPVGTILLKSDGDAITGLYFTDDGYKPPEDAALEIFIRCESELTEYFAGTRHTFSVKTKNAGTDFMERCWRRLLAIPYGETRSYKDIAEEIGNPKAVRAVGGANNKNNISIIYPCHRVIGKDGGLTGYGGGLWRKEWLLNHEKSAVYGKVTNPPTNTSGSRSSRPKRTGG